MGNTPPATLATLAVSAGFVALGLALTGVLFPVALPVAVVGVVAGIRGRAERRARWAIAVGLLALAAALVAAHQWFAP